MAVSIHSYHNTQLMSLLSRVGQITIGTDHNLVITTLGLQARIRGVFGEPLPGAVASSV